jgi:uncharacterized protein DUF4398
MRLVTSTVFALLVAACASVPAPTDQIAAARAMVNQAQPVAGKDAAVELHGAEDKLKLAEDAMQNGDYLHARIFAEQAELDAKYAWAVAENAKAQRASKEVETSIEALRKELERRQQ